MLVTTHFRILIIHSNFIILNLTTRMNCLSLPMVSILMHDRKMGPLLDHTFAAMYKLVDLEQCGHQYH